MIKGYTYITNGHIIKALNTIVNTTDLKITDSYYLKVISDYIPTKFYPGINQTYTANSVSYDSDLHYYLGLYLRYYRDLTGINLMHYYNCVSGEYSNNVDLTDSGVVHIDDYTDTGYKILKVNINFDETYSIYVDCASSFYIGASYEYKNNISNSIVITISLSYFYSSGITLRSDTVADSIYVSHSTSVNVPTIPVASHKCDSRIVLSGSISCVIFNNDIRKF